MSAERYTIGRTEYVRHESGLYFSADASPTVARLLARYAETRQRVRLFLGETATGKAWAEESDIVGTVGRSMGPCKVPLLIVGNARGGGAILTGCVVAIRECDSRRWSYRAPGFDPGEWRVAPADIPGYAETVTHNGIVHARFPRAGMGARYCEFMLGDRFTRGGR